MKPKKQTNSFETLRINVPFTGPVRMLSNQPNDRRGASPEFPGDFIAAAVNLPRPRVVFLFTSNKAS